MKNTVSLYDFRRAFESYDRDNFSYGGLRALFEYIEQYESDCDQEIELDVIALCCEYTEYNNIGEYYHNYNTPYINICDHCGEGFIFEDLENLTCPRCEQDVITKDTFFEKLRDYTHVINIQDSDKFIIQDY